MTAAAMTKRESWPKHSGGAHSSASWCYRCGAEWGYRQALEAVRAVLAEGGAAAVAEALEPDRDLQEPWDPRA